jgi:2-polyprenyl-3-methyl-5-hydroxy-6-metoxy-1,4-benzoquinol methylase
MDTYKSPYSYQYYNNKQPYDYSYIAPVVFQILKNRSDLRILELGCGNGYLSNTLSKMGNKVVGVDVSENGIEIGKNNYPEVQFIKSDICDLLNNQIINKESFDVVIAIEVIEHLQYPRELIRVARKYLKRGGN